MSSSDLNYDGDQRLWLITYELDLLGGQGSNHDHYAIVQCLVPSARAELETANELTERIGGRLSW